MARSSEKMQNKSKEGEVITLVSLFWLVTSLTFTHFRKFHTTMFISLKKYFSKSLDACFLFSVLKSVNSLTTYSVQNQVPDGSLLASCQGLSHASGCSNEEFSVFSHRD